jgi:hypothetical protein
MYLGCGRQSNVLSRLPANGVAATNATYRFPSFGENGSRREPHNASLVLLRACHCAMPTVECNSLDGRLTSAISARLQQQFVRMHARLIQKGLQDVVQEPSQNTGNDHTECCARLNTSRTVQFNERKQPAAGPDHASKYEEYH